MQTPILYEHPVPGVEIPYEHLIPHELLFHTNLLNITVAETVTCVAGAWNMCIYRERLALQFKHSSAQSLASTGYEPGIARNKPKIYHINS
jgi:hypothetical protein